MITDREESIDKFVAPAASLSGELSMPGDKSISHRSVMLGSIADGVTEVEGFLEGEDNISTISAFEQMGVVIERPAPGSLRIHGRGAEGLSEPGNVIDAGNSGTTTRLLTGLLSAQPFFTVLTGDDSLRSRPMKRVVVPLRLMGARISGRKDSTLLPLAITGGRLKGIKYSTPVASAQLKSSILLAGLFAEGETTVIESAVSRDHTERMLALFGADIKINKTITSVRSTNRLNGCRIVVPGDISSAAFFMVAAAVTPDSSLLIKNVGVNPTRVGIIEILRRMGAVVETIDAREVSGEPVCDMLVKSARLRGVDIGAGELLPAIDEFPIICVAAAFAEGKTVISGARELRVKESDRIAVMAEALRSVGVESVHEKEDGIVIEGTGSSVIKGGTVLSHGDHRIAMSMAVAALRSADGVMIRDAASVDVSFPGFFSHLEEVVSR